MAFLYNEKTDKTTFTNWLRHLRSKQFIIEYMVKFYIKKR